MKVLMLVITVSPASVIDPTKAGSLVRGQPQKAASLVRSEKEAALMLASESLSVPPAIEVSGELFEIDPDKASMRKVSIPEVEFKGGNDAHIQN